MVEPDPRPPFPGDWYPDMAERGLSLWKIRLGLDMVHCPNGMARCLYDHPGTLTVLSYEQHRPNQSVAYRPMCTTNSAFDFSWGPLIIGYVISEMPAKAIETMMANARWWINEERAR